MDRLKNLVGLPSGKGEDQSDVKYRECCGRGFLSGLAVGPIVFSLFYFGQTRFTRSSFGGAHRAAVLGSSWLFCISSSVLTWQHSFQACEKEAKQRREAALRKEANPLVS